MPTILVEIVVFGVFILLGAFLFRDLETTDIRYSVQRNNTALKLAQTICKHEGSVDFRMTGKSDRCEEMLNCSETVRHIILEQRNLLKKIISVSDAEHQELDDWNIASAMFFCFTLFTGIGYGNQTPQTMWGQLLTILYGFVGIPLFLLLLTDTGAFLNVLFGRLYRLITCSKRSKKPSAPNQARRNSAVTNSAVLLLNLVITCSYIAGGGVLFTHLESDWTFVESIYFCFQSLSTIGFGDMIPSLRNRGIVVAYVFVGLALLSMCMNGLQRLLRSAYSQGRVQSLAGPGVAPMKLSRTRI